MNIIIKISALSVLFALLNISFVFGAEYISFGSYPQSQVIPTEEIENAAYDSNGDGEAGNDKYRRAEDENGNYIYFKYEPISWEVLNIDNETFYAAKYILDSLKYDEQEDMYVSGLGGSLKYALAAEWETATIRKRLNSDFYNAAFTSEEKEKLTSISGDKISLLTVSQAESMEQISLKKTMY